MKRITFLFTLMLLAFSTQGWAESKNGTDFQEGDNWYLMLEDFEGTVPAMGSNMSGVSEIIEDAGNHLMKYACKAYNSSEYMYVDILIPEGISFSSTVFSAIEFKLKNSGWDVRNKTLNVSIGEINTVIGTITTQSDGQPIKVYAVPLTEFDGNNSVRLYIGGGYTTNSCYFELDDIRLKYINTPGPVGPKDLTGVSLKSATTITVGGSEKLVPTFTPSNATNKNVTWESNNTDVATVDNDGTVHGVAAGTATITVKTEDGGYTATCEVTVEETSSMNGQLYFDGTNVCLMVEDFEGSPVISLVNDKGGNASLKDITISDKTTKALKYETGKGQGDEYVAIKVALPAGKTLSDVYSDLIFDVVYDGTGSDNNYKQVKICLNETSNMISNAQWGEAVTDNWVLKSYSLSGKYTNENIFTLLVGGVYSNGMKYYIDNIRLKLTSTASGTNAGANIGWSYNAANTTLTFAGTGAMADFSGSSSVPWKDYKSTTTNVIVAEGITTIGKTSFYQFSKMTSIILPSTLTLIREQSFKAGDGTTSWALPEITIPANVETIESSAFKCIGGSFATVNFENGSKLISIKSDAFNGCNNLTSVNITSPYLEELGTNALRIKNKEVVITLHSNPTGISGALYSGNYKECNLVLNDAEKPFMAATSENTYNNVTYTRNYASLYSTTILPFAPETVEGVTYYAISSATDNSVTFTTVDNPIENTPYLIGLTAVGEKEFSAANVTIPANQTKASTSAADWTMTGTYVKADKAAADNAYGFSGGQLYKNTGTMTVNPFRAYFTTASSNAKAVMDVEFGNTPTAINNLENGSFEFNEVYNLNGVRQNSLQNGVNIVKMANGKTMKIILNK